MLRELGISRGDAYRYVLLPQIWPRLKKLVGSGFTYIPLFVLMVFNTIGIIPNDHELMRREHQGKHSLIKVLAAAAANIDFSWKNIDKITIFVVVLGGIVMLGLQIVLCILALIALPAYAYAGPGLGPSTLPEFFGNNTPDTDIAFRIMDLVFGLPGIFTSTAVTTPFHAGFHALLGFYSFGILLVGAFVIIYLATTIVLETAQSGVPFGQRFNKAWAPVRLILFFGLLLPTASGINLGQYVLLNAAKYGSNLATNGWILFDQTVRGPYIGTPEQLIATPQTVEVNSLIGFMAIARTCAWAEGRQNARDIRSYFVFGSGADGALEFEGGAPAFVDLVSRAQGGTLLIRFGEQDADLYPDEMGAVYPYCGELTLTITDQAQPGAAYIQQAYLALISCMWSGESGGLGDCRMYSFDDMAEAFTQRYMTVLPRDPYPNMEPYVGDSQKLQLLILANDQLEAALEEAVERQQVQGSWARDPAQNLGWAGAAIWFNKLAEQNGALTTAVMAKPSVRKMPAVMEYIRTEKLKETNTLSSTDMYTPTLPSGKMLEFKEPQDREIALVLNNVYKYWNLEDSTSYMQDTPQSQNSNLTGNIVIDSLNLLFGTKGLFDMCRNTDIHPLAQLSAMGKGLIEHSIGGFAIAFGVGVGGGVAAILKFHEMKQALMGATSFLITIASIGFTVGFILFYVIPFLPFIYFFFAVMTWVKSIFEAMVGMPLWALAHLRIDGQGMPGEAASHGYFYIFEIFLRPLAIIISFLGALVIFSSLVKVLNSIFYLVIANLSGHDAGSGSGSLTGCFIPPGAEAGGEANQPGAFDQNPLQLARGVVDQFFYTVIYAIMVYLMAAPCFKLVDAIPDNLMRWFGSGISTFGAQDGDPADGLIKYVSGGIMTLAMHGRSLTGAFTKFKS